MSILGKELSDLIVIGLQPLSLDSRSLKVCIVYL